MNLDQLPVWSAENPFLCRKADDSLELLVLHEDSRGAGIPLLYTGGPLLLEWEMRLTRNAFPTPVEIGLAGPDSLFAGFSESGSEQKPRTLWSLSWHAGPLPGGSSFMEPDRFKPEVGDWFSVAIEYVPWMRRAWMECERKEDHQFYGTSVLMDSPLRPGSYVFGLKGRNERRPGATYSSVQIRNFRIASSDDGTKFQTEPSAQTAEWRVRFAEANGLLAQGSGPQADGGLLMQKRAQEAILRYDELLAEIAAPRPRTQEMDLREFAVRFFRAVALARTGFRDEARSLLVALEESNADEFPVLRAESEIGMSAEDLELLGR